MEQQLVPSLNSVNGHSPPPILDDEGARIERAYAEIQRRDSGAERRTWRAERVALALLAALVVTIGVVLWQAYHARDVQAFVQIVQVDDKGGLVQMGVPQSLLSYTPEDGIWLDMIAEWIRKTRWKGTDVTLAHAEWAWAYQHTCGGARRRLQEMEKMLQPFATNKKTVSVEVTSVFKSESPQSYQALWVETHVNSANPTPQDEPWTGVFTVGRYQPPTIASMLANRLGLCITAFNPREKPAKP